MRKVLGLKKQISPDVAGLAAISPISEDLNISMKQAKTSSGVQTPTLGQSASSMDSSLTTSSTYIPAPPRSSSQVYSQKSKRTHQPVCISGWMYKPGSFIKTQKHKRYMKLKGYILSNHHSENSPATWEINITQCPVSCGHKALEFIIQLPMGKKASFYVENEKEYNYWIQAFQTAMSQGLDSSIEDYYILIKNIGSGSYAEVFLAQERESKEMFAIKCINKKELVDVIEMDAIIREMNIMKSISHPNIIAVHDIFDTKDYLYLVLEYMGGGELFDVIANQGFLTERMAAHIMKDILKGVSYLHMMNIVHRDLKPENLLCKNKPKLIPKDIGMNMNDLTGTNGKGSLATSLNRASSSATAEQLQVKIADFGLASFCDENGYLAGDSLPEGTRANGRAKVVHGTVGYLAPEGVNGKRCGPPVDIWACGVILYIMLSGRMPWKGISDDEIQTEVALGRYSFPDEEWKNISEDAKSLVRSLLQYDPEKRLTAQAALNHRWFANFEDPAYSRSSSLQDRPTGNKYTGIHSSKRKFRKAIIAAASINKMAALSKALKDASSQQSGPSGSELPVEIDRTLEPSIPSVATGDWSV